MHDYQHIHQAHSPEEAKVLLKYMVDHNVHHSEELHELAHSLPEEVSAIVHEALEVYNKANTKLQEAYDLLVKED